MEIVIHAMGMPFNGATVEKQSLGGSESAAYYQARELARRGHRVSVWTTTQEEGEWDGVRYFNVGAVSEQFMLGDRFEFWARNTPHDVLIIQRHPMAFHKPFASKVNIWQLHDLALHRNAGVSNFGLWQVNFVTAVSQYHKRQIHEIYGIDKEFIKVVPNGVDESLYEGSVPPLATTGINDLSGKFLMLYQSRPERGLENLVKPGGIMDQLKDTNPNVHLLYCAYANTVPQMQGYYAQLDAWAKRLPNVTGLGALTKKQLANVQRQCDLLCYPTKFKEVSCITVMEAMHAGLPVLTTDAGALPETIGHESGATIICLKDGEVNIDGFVSEIRASSAEKDARLSKMQRNAAKFCTWSRAVNCLLVYIDEQFGDASSSAIARHAIEFSDIEMLGYASDSDRISARVINKEKELYSFLRSDEDYELHYDKHQTAYYDGFEEKVIGEDVTPSSRFRGVCGMLEQIVQGTPPDRQLRVLDYGCAHGHYIVPLAKRFPQVQFVGMDVSARAIGAATRWIHKEGLGNVELRIGSESDLTAEVMCPVVKQAVLDVAAMERGDRPERLYFDVVIAGEVIEHVRDYGRLLESFRSIMKDDGYLIATTPVGRWEWTGHEAFKTGREHVVHFERADIVELCGDNSYNIAYAPASNDETGKFLGSWVWMVQPRAPFGEIDLDRKAHYLSPRQTLSACLILKDSARTLRRCVESFIEYVDEIVLAIDPSTKDRTWEVAEQIQSDYPLKPIVVMNGIEALKDGFDAARNFSTSRASGDWILWVDADEEVLWAQNLWKYLRPSMHPAYGFPQVHYSAAPAGVLTTDYPCRLFRNRRGIKFYGLVHEHPETAPGKAIEFSTIRHDVQFLHCGYVDETTRRQRFHRNLPLVLKDVEKYPQRRLNNFLLLRDLAQGIVFEQEQAGGTLEDHPARAKKGIELFEKILEHEAPRMIVDVMKYYSICVTVLGVGFDARTVMQIVKPEAPDLKVDLTVEGRFYSRAHFQKLLNRLQEEATKHYESEYL
jgi:glycosyltransferase involved in cell wall biosynthesis/SAM-dependent methyltransferase